MSNFLSLSKIFKSFYQGNQQINVLENINITFNFDTSYAITGPSGSGKSTLIHLLAGTDSPDSGEINWCDDFLINNLTFSQKESFWNQEIGLIFQQPCLIDELTVLENVMLKGVISGDKQSNSLAKDLLLAVGLKNREGFFPGVLSRGERQRVAIARALMCTPKLILADEPTSSLDRACGMEIINMLIQLSKDRHIGLILSTHDEYVYRNMDEVVKIADGKLSLNT